MNREIKFRAYNGSVMSHYPELYEWNTEYCDLDRRYVTLMQYTGLKDKNGKEIYEGDIVQMWLEDSVLPEGGYFYKTEVRMHNGCWCLIDPGCSYKQNMPSTVYDYIDAIEVIGNIHEHPELLKP